jgi:hypothetical protein
VKVPTLTGMTFVTRDKGGFALSLDHPTHADFEALLHWLPEGWEVDFHDPYFPQLSDPGAYVLIQRRGDRFLHRLGNHGWLNHWTHQSPDLLAAYLQLVADYPGERTAFDGPIMVKPAYRSAWDDQGPD